LTEKCVTFNKQLKSHVQEKPLLHNSLMKHSTRMIK